MFPLYRRQPRSHRPPRATPIPLPSPPEGTPNAPPPQPQPQPQKVAEEKPSQIPAAPREKPPPEPKRAAEPKPAPPHQHHTPAPAKPYEVPETMPMMPSLRQPEMVFVLTRQPDKVWCEFLSTFTTLQPVLVVDDNTIDLVQWRQRYPTLSFLQLHNHLCEERGFKEMSYLMIRKRVTAWDKAMLLASQIAEENPRLFERAWFVEEDVFFHSETTLLDIDDKHDAEDLLCSSIYMHFPHPGAKTNSWGHWKHIHPAFPAPYYHGMMCAVRMSRSLIAAVQQYAAENRQLFFLEALFPSLAMHHHLAIATPEEFRPITWNGTVLVDQVESVSLFHPVKVPQQHVAMRQKISPTT